MGTVETPSGAEAFWHKINFHEMGLSRALWRHQMEAFSVILALCAGNLLVTGKFPSQKVSNADFDVSLMWVRLSCKTNSTNIGDLRLHDAHVTSS